MQQQQYAGPFARFGWHDDWKDGLSISAMITAAYAVICVFSMTLTGHWENAGFLAFVGAIVLVGYFPLCLSVPQEFKDRFQINITTREEDAIRLGLFVSPPLVFIAGSVINGVLYTFRTLNLAGILVFAGMALWFYVGYQNAHDNDESVTVRDWATYSAPIPLTIVMITFVGMMWSMATLTIVGLIAILFVTACATIYSYLTEGSADTY